MRSNKFNIQWQVVRVKARQKKCVREKASYVADWYSENMNTHNYDRVKNWFTMTAMAYKGENKALLLDVLSALEKTDIEDDSANDFGAIKEEDLWLVYKDLKKRKYGFQFNKIPADHISFMKKLTEYLQIK